MIWNKDFDPKFALFGGEEGKKMVVGVGTNGFCTKSVHPSHVS